MPEAQTQRSLQHFSIGHDLIPREMITVYAVPKQLLGAGLALLPFRPCGRGRG